MNKVLTYQEIVNSVRAREAVFGRWPGHGGPAFSRYPNLAAELAARGWSLETLCKAAGVSGEVMAGVIEDGDELEAIEICGIANRLGVAVGYLRSPVLAIIAPTTRKGKRRKYELMVLTIEAENHYCPILNSWETLPKMEHGRPVTFAAWRRACWELQDQLEECPQQPIRTTKHIQEMEVTA